MSNTTHSIEAILEYLRAELLAGVEGLDLDAETDLLVSGLIDSLGVMRLVGFLENEFGISVPPEDVTIEHFQSVNVIADYVERRRS